MSANLLQPSITRANDWVADRIFPIMFAFAIAGCYVMWQIRSDNDRLHNLLRISDDRHDSECATMRGHRQTVLDFWTNTGYARSSHAAHEMQAETLWGSIANEMARDRIGTQRLTGMIGKVSQTWGQLSLDDSNNAALAREYVSDLQAEYDKTCAGPVPTPRPPRV